MARNRQASARMLNERVTMPGRYIDPTLGVQRKCAAALEHDLPHKFAQKYTFHHSKAKEWAGQTKLHDFFNDDNDLARTSLDLMKKISH
jgi:hypothetical protein